MHEIVFGVKPRWSESGAGEMLPPEIGRKLTEEERAALEACRACAAKEPARRIASAAEAGRLLTERRRWWWRKRRLAVSRRPVIVAGALTVVAAVAVGMLRSRPRPPDTRPPSTQQSPPDRPDRRARRLDRRLDRARRGPRTDPVHAPAAGPAHDPFRLGHAAARRGHRHRHAEAHPIAPRPGRLRRGLSRPLARWQAPRLSGARAGRPRVRVSFAACRRQGRRAGRADGGADDVVGADVAGRRPDLLLRRRHKTHGRIFDRGKPDESAPRSDAQATGHVVPVCERRPGLRCDASWSRPKRSSTGISVPSMEETVRFRLPGLALDLRPAGSVFYATSFSCGEPHRVHRAGHVEQAGSSAWSYSRSGHSISNVRWRTGRCLSASRLRSTCGHAAT